MFGQAQTPPDEGHLKQACLSYPLKLHLGLIKQYDIRQTLMIRDDNVSLLFIYILQSFNAHSPIGIHVGEDRGPPVALRMRCFSLLIEGEKASARNNIAKNSGAIVLRHIVNLGKGAALKTGCDYAVRNMTRNTKKSAKNNEKNPNILIFIDGDGQHDADMIPVFTEKLKDCDIAIGVRRFNKKMPFVMKFGNNFINFIINLLFHVKISDSQSGYRAVWAENYRKIRWKSQDYSMESEMIANIGKHKLKYSQVPIPTIYNDEYKGTTVVDGFRIVYNIIKWKLAGL